MAVRFVLWIVWFALAVLRYAHVSCDSAYPPAELRCAPESLLPAGGGQGVGLLLMWTRNSHLGPSLYYRGRLQIPTLSCSCYWLGTSSATLVLYGTPVVCVGKPFDQTNGVYSVMVVKNGRMRSVVELM